MWTFKEIRTRVLIILVCSLSVTVLLKVGEIQYLELILAADFLVLSFLFCRNGWRAHVFQPFFSVASSWGIFLVLAFLLALLGLGQTFYSFNDTLLKRPLLVTLARMMELFLDVFYMLYLATLYREDESLGKLGARTYYWMGVAGGIYAIVSFPLSFIYDVQLGTINDLHRLRGFNNEGGSYGTYLIGVFLLTLAMRRRDWLSRNEFRYGMALFGICLLGSQSKAAIIAIAMLGFINLLFLTSGLRRIILFAVVGVCLLLVVSTFNFGSEFDAYVRGAAAYQNLSKLRSSDGNFVMGRVAGMVLSPRMIAAHPLVGIGWGNYPLVRDDPEYRRGAAFSIGSTDSPSLGPIDYIVELGFPLFFYLTWAELKPLYLLWRHRADTWILNMAAMQLLANWFGAHLNLTYQWVVVGLALGMGFSKAYSKDVLRRTMTA